MRKAIWISLTVLVAPAALAQSPSAAPGASGSPAPSGSVSPSLPPMDPAALASLMAVIPPELAAICIPDTYWQIPDLGPDPGEIASVDCDPDGSGGNYVTYSLFDGNASMDAFYDEQHLGMSAMGALAVAGLFSPVRMLPLLVFEIAWMAIWVSTVALPKWLDGSLDDGTLSILFNCAVVLPFIFVVPWTYVARTYLRSAEPVRSTAIAARTR